LPLPLSVVPSPELVHYRHKACFSLCRRSSGRIACMVFDPECSKSIAIEQYPIASRRINQLMTDVCTVLNGDQRAGDEAFEVEFLSNNGGGALACIKYHRHLDVDKDRVLAWRLSEQLRASVVLRARGQRIISRGRNSYLVHNSQVGDRCFSQHLLEGGFFQVNLRLNRLMQRWVQQQTRRALGTRDTDLLELFCGNGNFTLPAAGNFRRVLATELNQYAVRAATSCAQKAGIQNVTFKKLKAEDVDIGDSSVSAAGKGSSHFDFRTLLVDPPRKGLDSRTLQLARRFERIAYISCNPHSLARDLRQLPEHRIVDACLFDQFPWTDHAEVAMLLEHMD